MKKKLIFCLLALMIISAMCITHAIVGDISPIMDNWNTIGAPWTYSQSGSTMYQCAAFVNYSFFQMYGHSAGLSTNNVSYLWVNNTADLKNFIMNNAVHGDAIRFTNVPAYGHNDVTCGESHSTHIFVLDSFTNTNITVYESNWANGSHNKARNYTYGSWNQAINYSCGVKVNSDGSFQNGRYVYVKIIHAAENNNVNPILPSVTPETTVQPVVPSTPSEVKDAVYNYLTNTMGLNQAAACAVLANMEAESSFITDNKFNEINGNESYGLCQWGGGRRTSLEAYCRANGFAYNSIEGQLGYMNQELHTSAYSNVLSKLQSVPNTAQGAYDAAFYWCFFYEKPDNATSSGMQRGRNAATSYWTSKYGYSGHGNDSLNIEGQLACMEVVNDCVYVYVKLATYVQLMLGTNSASLIPSAADVHSEPYKYGQYWYRASDLGISFVNGREYYFKVKYVCNGVEYQSKLYKFTYGTNVITAADSEGGTTSQPANPFVWNNVVMNVFDDDVTFTYRCDYTPGTGNDLKEIPEQGYMINGSKVYIEDKTKNPFSGNVSFFLETDKPVSAKQNGAVLQPGTQYSYCFYVVFRGVTYTGGYGTFTTTGAAPHKLYLDSNGGSAPSQVSVTVRTGTYDYCDMSWNIPARSGFAFAGWYTNSTAGTMVYNSSGNMVNDGVYWSGSKWVYNGDVTLYAHWTDVEKPVVTNIRVRDITGTGFRVYCDASDNAGIDHITFYTYVINEADQTLSLYAANTTSGSNTWWADISITKHGYRNNCVYVVEARAYDAAGNVSDIDWTADNPQTFVYVEMHSMPTVTFDATGGTCATTSTTVTYGSLMGSLPEPTRSSYRFDGWYTDANFGYLISSYSLVPYENDFTLYAHWTYISPLVISDAYVTNVNANSFDVIVTVLNPDYFADIWCFVWNDVYGDELMLWGKINDGATVIERTSSYITTKTHFDTAGLDSIGNTTYHTKIQAKDNSGAFTDPIFVSCYIDNEAPSVSNLKVSNVTASGYTVSCDVYDENGIDRVRFPTWVMDGTETEYDIVWYPATLSGTATTKHAEAYISVENHNFKRDFNYCTEVRAYDTFGNVNDITTASQIYTYVDGTAPVVSNVHIANVTKDGYDVVVSATDNNALSLIALGSWNDTIGIGNAIWQYADVSGTSASATIHVSINQFDSLRDTNYYTNVFAIDAAGIWTADTDCKQVTTYIDGTAPTVTKTVITDVTADGFTVVATVSDNIGVTSVKVDTWIVGDYDATQRYDVATISGDTATLRVHVSNFGNRNDCQYSVCVYAKDAAGNQSDKNKGQAFADCYVDATAPVISNVHIADVTSDGFTVICTVTDNHEMGFVDFVSWSAYQGADDTVCNRATYEDGVAMLRINTADHGGALGYYYTDIYACDAAGNYSYYYNIPVKLVPGVVSVEETDLIDTSYYGGHKYSLYRFSVNDHGTVRYANWEEAKEICETLGGHMVTISSAEENAVVKTLSSANGGYPIYIGLSDENNEGSFEWITGEALSYSNWAAGQPDNASTNLPHAEDYCYISSSGKWYDMEYAFTASAMNFMCVCEFDSDNKAPSVPVLEVIRVDSTGYTLSATSSDNFSIDCFVVEVWNEYDDAPAVYLLPANGDTAEIRVDIADYYGAFGLYYTKVCAYDGAGNVSEPALISVSVTDPGWQLKNGVLTITDDKAWNYSDNNAPWHSDKSDITSVVIASGVTRIGNDAFYECYNLSDVSIPASITTIGENAFEWCYSLKTIEIPDSVVSIGTGAFAFCDNLTSVKLPSGLKVIENSMFDGCYNLTTVQIPQSVISIGDAAFGQTAIAELVLPAKLETIGNQAFAYVSNLNKITIPTSVKSIGYGAFMACTKLKSVYVHQDAPAFIDIPFAVFEYCDRVTVHVHPGSNMIDYCKAHNIRYDFQVDSNIIRKTTESHVIICSLCDYAESGQHSGNCADSEICTLCGAERYRGFVLQNPALRVHHYTEVNYECKDCLSSFGQYPVDDTIKLPSSIKTVKAGAFSNTNVAWVIVPESCVSIEAGAFTGCNNLRGVFVMSSDTKVDYAAFDKPIDLWIRDN